MIIIINEVKTLVKHVSYDCKCKLDNTTCNYNQKCINNKSMWVINQRIVHVKKIIAEILAHAFVRIVVIWKVLLMIL